jgi:hypothetical protein
MMNAFNGDLFVLLWSHEQNAMHIETLDETFSKNRRAYSENKPGDYRVLMIGYREEVDAAARSCRQTTTRRSKNAIQALC